MAKKNKNGYVLKSDVLSLIQSYIRDIQMMDSVPASLSCTL